MAERATEALLAKSEELKARLAEDGVTLRRGPLAAVLPSGQPAKSPPPIIASRELAHESAHSRVVAARMLRVSARLLVAAEISRIVGKVAVALAIASALSLTLGVFQSPLLGAAVAVVLVALALLLVALFLFAPRFEGRMKSWAPEGAMKQGEKDLYYRDALSQDAEDARSQEPPRPRPAGPGENDDDDEDTYGGPAIPLS